MRESQALGKIEVVKWDRSDAVTWQRRFFVTFANAFCAEAGELGLNTRAFTVTKFLYFLVCGQVSPPAPGIAIGNSSVSGGLTSPGAASHAASSAVGGLSAAHHCTVTPVDGFESSQAQPR